MSETECCDECGQHKPADAIGRGWYLDSELLVDGYNPVGYHVVTTVRCPECW